jgi:NAD(P)H-dependent flavin oxidoreductase YrpB (nitropropane dioxygenase family)
MSWASSNAPLIIAVSNAGGLGVLAAGPMRVEDFSRAVKEIRSKTKKPWGVNIPLNGKHAAELLQIALEEKIRALTAQLQAAAAPNQPRGLGAMTSVIIDREVGSWDRFRNRRQMI